MSLQPQVIASARAEFSAGRPGPAEAACLSILKDNPADPEALHLLGLIRFQGGQGAEGAALVERALQAAPGFAAAQSDLGAMLVMLGRPAEAVPRLRTAVTLIPGSADAHLNLGNALHAHGHLQAAEEPYRTALRIDSRNLRTNLSLGNLLRDLGRPQESCEYLRAAVALAPGAMAPHLFLGKSLGELGRTEDAIGSYRRAIALEPANADANESLGRLFAGEGRHAEALICFRAASARAPALECLLHLGRHEEFFEEIERQKADVATDLECAALSAYASCQLGRPDPHPYCPNPMEHVRIVDRYTGAGANAEFLRDLIRNASQIEERPVSTDIIKSGFQSRDTLFGHDSSALQRLHGAFAEELRRYRAEPGRTSMAISARWPEGMRLVGSFVRLRKGGYLDFHNHLNGWMSGCIYLQMPKSARAGEGAIEFSLNRGDYPILTDRPLPTLRHIPQPGQIIMFPASLFHRTIPFHSDEERLCINFDLLPDTTTQ